MGVPLLRRGIPLLRLRHLPLRLSSITLRQTYCSAASASATAEDSSSSITETLKDPPPQNPPIWDKKWKDQEALIFQDVEPITSQAQQILHTDRYKDGGRLTVEDEKFVKEKLLAHHPHSKDKIGCGLDSIMVDHHPQFRHTRCLFVVRTDGECVDFSYRKCLREYIQDKYPSHAERFIKEHFKRASS